MFAVLSGCGGDEGRAPPVGDGGSATNDDAMRVDASVAEAGADVPYPAPHPAISLVAYHGGKILTAPRLVTITFANETRIAQIASIGAANVSSAWWSEVTRGFCDADGGCVGPATNTNVTLPDSAPSTMLDDDLRQLLATRILDGTLPAPTPDSVYEVYFPPSTVLQADQVGAPCTGYDGFHLDLALPLPAVTDAGGTAVSIDATYAVVLTCPGTSDLALAASHEFVEAVTDPTPPLSSNATPYGYAMDDEAHYNFSGPEVADLCGYDPTVDVDGNALTRVWSNASASAGHNPCVPEANGETYFNIVLDADTFTLAAGESVTVTATAYSDGPLQDWQVGYIDMSSADNGPKLLTVAAGGRKTANNGDVFPMTINVVGEIPAGSFAVGAIYSQIGGASGPVHYAPFLVHSK